jgi:UDP-N-acetylglucosamine 2-epimerase (non-hydrolysing)
MIHFFIGTKAQFIKMAPVMVEMNKRRLPFRYIDSGQHADLTRSLRKVLGIRDPDVFLGRNTGSIVSIAAAVRWYIGYRWKSIANPRWLKNEVFPGGGICLIHGDTLSTLLGMKMAMNAGLKIAHVEAGLRSFDIWNPFPEELIRIRCIHKSDLLFAPSDEALVNLQKMGLDEKKVVRTDGNTVVDAMRLINNEKTTIQIPDKPFALATCHRLETIARKERLETVVRLLNRVAQDMIVLFVMHYPTLKYLKRFDLLGLLNAKIRKIDMLDYHEFVALEKNAQIVLTDGGSIQEECSYLNKPCLILRNTIERFNGLDRNAVLWRFNDKIADSFLSQQNLSFLTDLDKLARPSAQIIDALIRLNYIQ